MRFQSERAERDIEHARTEAFTEKCRKVKSAFTRMRKITLLMLLMTILDRRGVTLSMEIRRFKQLGIINEKITKTAYLKQRKRLNPLALLDLVQFHNRGLYDDGEMNEYKGYLLLAADGSSINVPTSKETLSLYGTSSRKGRKPQASLGLSCLYDCINKTILTCSINRVKFNEAGEAEKHLAELPSLVGKQKSILVLDRGYPSLPLLLRMNEKGQKFVIRLSSTDFKREQQGMKTNDEMVEILVTKSRLQHYKNTPDYDMLTVRYAHSLVNAGHITLRMVKLVLPSGIVEYLITNLSMDEFSTDEITKLYAYRWGIETAFDTLKNKLCLENFTGTKPILIEQDIYASIYICNLASDVIADAEAELVSTPSAPQSEPGQHSVKKYPMAVNRSFAIGILKDLLITAILADSDRKEELFKQMVSETKSEVLPVRHGRQFKRTKGVLAGKYSNSRKRCF